MNPDIESRIMLAAANRVAARARLTDTLASLQNRLDPRTLAAQAMDQVRERSHAFADEAGEYVRQRKPTFIAIAVAAALIYFRRDLVELFSRLSGNATAGTSPAPEDLPEDLNETEDHHP